MPLYDYECPRCGERFEARLGSPEESLSCPACGADAKRSYSSFAGPFTVGLRGAAARRSNAQRGAREEQRYEGFAKQREEREQRGKG